MITVRKQKWEAHKMTLNRIKDKEEKQYQQQSQKERDAVYAGMLHNLERTSTLVNILLVEPQLFWLRNIK